MIIRILNVLVFARGCTKEKHSADSQNYHLTKRLMSDPVRGNKFAPEWMTREFITLQHQVVKSIFQNIVGFRNAL